MSGPRTGGPASAPTSGAIDLVTGQRGGPIRGSAHPGRTINGHHGAGAVDHYWYDDATQHYFFVSSPTRATAGFAGTPEAGDRFGSALAVSSWGLLIGAPGESVGRASGAGAVQTFDRTGTPTKFRPVLGLTQNSKGIPGVAEAGDHLGASLAVGFAFFCFDDFDVAIGSPGEDIGSVKNAGSVTVYSSGSTVFHAGGGICHPETLTQSHGGLGGKVEAGDDLGAALGVIRDSVSSDGGDSEDAFDTLLVGSRGEDVGAISNAGIVTEDQVAAAGEGPGPTFRTLFDARGATSAAGYGAAITAF